MTNQPALTLSPAMLALLLRQTNIAVLRLTLEGAVTLAEGTALSWFRSQHFVGRQFSELVEQPALFEQLLTQARSGELAARRIVVRNEHANYSIDASTGALLNTDTIPVGDRIWNISCQLFDDVILLVGEDETELVEAQIARDELLQGVNGILWHADISLEEGALRWNLRIMNEEMGPQFLELKLEPGQTWGQVWVQSRHPGDSERMNKTSADALVSGLERYTQVFRCYDAHGNIHYLSEDVQIQRLAPMRWRLVGLCTDVTQLQEQSQRLLEFEMLAHNTLDAVFIFGMNRRIRYVNPAAVRHLGYARMGDLIGFHAVDIIAQEDLQTASERILPQLAQGWNGDLQLKRSDGSAWPTNSRAFLLSDANGVEFGSVLSASDRSEQRRIELERQQLQEDLIQAQRATLRELSTPLIPLADGVIAMPLVGSIDTARAEQIMETLLEGISHLQAEHAIIDITGVKMEDTQVADVLLRVARAAQLLGAQVILTGISAEIAQSLVQLGAELRGIVTLANLQAGITYALKQNQEH